MNAAVEWPRGEAAACKAAYTGSNPVSTSSLMNGVEKMSPFTRFTVNSPVGTWHALADLDRGKPTVIAVTLGDADELFARLTADESARGSKPSKDAGGLAQLVRAYFGGNVNALDAIAVEQPGTPFKQSVLKAMRRIKPGSPASYAELAKRADHANAVRATASACATNRIPLIVPCHRVVRTGGAVGNYYYGAEVKRWLLQHEAANSAS